MLTVDELRLVAEIAQHAPHRCVIQDDCYPQAHAAAEAGWLRREFLDDGEMGWSLTATGLRKLALLTYAFRQTVGRQN